MSLTIRPATADDVDLILSFIKELALYEKEPEAAQATAEDILRDAFGEQPLVYVLIAEWEEQAAGMALYFFNYSTWQGRRGLYLEDLFVRPPFRGKGLGKALLAQLAQIALEKHCGRMQWQVLNWNTSAIQFYESLGARSLEEWSTYRLEGPEIAKLAATR